MIYILAGIVGSCVLICVASLILKIWEIAEQRETARHRAYRRSCRVRTESAVRYEI